MDGKHLALPTTDTEAAVLTINVPHAARVLWVETRNNSAAATLGVNYYGRTQADGDGVVFATSASAPKFPCRKVFPSAAAIPTESTAVAAFDVAGLDSVVVAALVATGASTIDIYYRVS